MPESKQDFFRRYTNAIATRDFSTLETMVHPDYVGEYPQSGERFRGFDALRFQLEHYPGGLPGADYSDSRMKVLGEEERWAPGTRSCRSTLRNASLPCRGRRIQTDRSGGSSRS